jgi:hypothetical protein
MFICARGFTQININIKLFGILKQDGQDGQDGNFSIHYV